MSGQVHGTRFHLRRAGCGAIGAGMKGCFPCLLAVLAVISSSCEEKTEIVVTESRGLTTRDKEPKLFATSDERFRDAKPSPVKAGEIPDGWLALPAALHSIK